MTVIDGVQITFPANDVGDLGLGKDLVFRTPSAGVTFGHQPVTLEAGSSVVGLATELFDEGASIQNGGQRQQGRFDTGGGVHTYSIAATTWQGSQYRWGADDGSRWDATGADPLTQATVLDKALSEVRIGSVEGGIDLEVADYNDQGGRWGPRKVAPLEPEISFEVDEQASSVTVTMSFIDLLVLEDAVDAASDALLREDE